MIRPLSFRLNEMDRGRKEVGGGKGGRESRREGRGFK